MKEVENLKFDDKLSRFCWTAPERSKLCNLQYQIQFKNDIIEEESTTSDAFFEILLYPCSTNTITVTTTLGFDDSRSSPVSDTHLGPVTRKLPIHISTNPKETGAETIWIIEREARNFCHIDKLRYNVIKLETGDEIDFLKSFEKEDDIEFALTPLEVGKMYQYKVCYIFSDLIICSLDVTFLTEALPKPLITVETNIDDNLQISWDQNSRFATKHTVIIQTIGPEHFIPTRCYNDYTPIEKHFDITTTSYTLENPKPSFRYNVQVVSYFEGLGMTTKDEEFIITSEGTPGQLDVQFSYDILPSLTYEVSLFINWSIPCDINGKIERLSYIVNSNLDVYDLCSDLQLDSGDIAVEDFQEYYDIPVISRILPFFKYSIEVVTHLREHQSITAVDLGEAPQAYTPYY
ncbi:hypothetical protein Trydic_g3030 [Trypoxylus dichotomus]